MRVKLLRLLRAKALIVKKCRSARPKVKSDIVFPLVDSFFDNFRARTVLKLGIILTNL